MDNGAKKMRDEFVEAAAGEALGASGAAESAEYQKSLATASDAEQALDGELRETVARLAAASPHMNPPESLRGRILQETAPTVFRMEDYKKVNTDSSRLYKWGFYAAMLFLAAGAWYNMDVKQQLATTQNAAKTQTAMLVAAKAQVASLANEVQNRNLVLNNIVNPQSRQIGLTHEGKVVGTAFVNTKTGSTVVAMAEGLIPPNMMPQISMKNEKGEMTKVPTMFVSVPREAFPQLPQINLPNSDVAIRNVEPDPSRQIYRASFGQ